MGGRKDGVGRTPAGRAVAVAMSSRLAVGNSTYHFGTRAQEVDHLPFGAYPVALVRELGGWDETLVANEDFEFDYRLRGTGGRLLFDPDLVISWHCRQSIPALFRQYRRYGRGKVDVAVLHPRSLGLRHVTPPLFVAYLAAALALAPRRPVLAQALLAPYVVAVVGESVRLAPRLHRRTEQRAHPRGDHGDARRLGPRVLVRRRTSGTVLGLRCFPSGVTRKYPASGLTSGLGGRREYERG